MIFNTVAYFALFLLPSAVLYRRLTSDLRPWLLAFSGAAFFVFFSLTTPIGGWRGALCLTIILWQALCCLWLRQNTRMATFLTIVQALILLAVFKYSNFFGGLFYGGDAKASPLYWKDVFLPLGISFFTFEFIHYAADVRTGKFDPKQVRPGELLAFFLFFPTMVAGPIKRIQDFLPKLRESPGADALDWHRGVTRILVGLVKKFAIADFLTALTDHLNKNDILRAGGPLEGRLTLLLWVFAYGFKIYFDFSAYSDIAIGSARLFGIRVPENFNAPYIRRNIAEFWQSWHISLYRWLVDYVFIPLGGSRVAPILIYRNLIVVMLASGLWHGAGLNYIVWGIWHAALLCLHRLWSRHVSKDWPASPALSFAGWITTFVSVNLGWAFFAMDFSTALLFLQKIVSGTGG